MKKSTVLSGIASLLLVAGFYTFAFCLVEDVDEEPISMDFYYSTETDADTGEDIGEATSAAVSEYAGMDYSDIVTKREAVTTVPPNFADDSEIPMSLPSGHAEELGDTNENKNTASHNNVLADDNDQEKKLSQLGSEDDPADDLMEDQQDYDEDADDDDDVIIDDDPSPEDDTASTVASDAESLADIAPVSVADVIVTIDDTPTETTPTFITTEAVTEASTVSSNGNEVFTAKYGGSVHTDDAFDLVCRIVNNEISASFSDEAIRAQAVAAYSYVKYHNVNGLTPTVLVKSDPPQRIVDLVSSVWGKCCYYNGKVAQTVYMASSSGYTASSVNVWGGSIPYLVSVECPFDADGDPNYGKQTKFSESEIRSALERYLGITLSDNPENWLTVTGHIDGNYVSTVDVDGQATITGRKLRESVLSYNLKSASFDISYSDGYFIFTTYGWGHGVGMSQNGANYLAKLGYTYDQILKYYYTGIDVL
ncbi:MAG: SpoIID/LytB domain-containing protein [Oscillospiraceae bacterium]|nr:SpoIID/LytB domain-containing protein [Oscillospiraceae bacterium]